MIGTSRSSRFGCFALVVLVSMIVFPCMAAAQQTGAIFTTNSTGTAVNANIYANMTDVYLTGGPQNEHATGLTPNGIYVFQVTDPSGATLLSTDDISCREVVVSGGKVTGVPSDPGACTTGFHAFGTVNAGGELPVQLWRYNSTPNPGNEYKVWMTPYANYSPDSTNPQCSTTSNITFGFCTSDSATDNFKVIAGAAHITVCKFNDLNDDGIYQQSIEPLLAHWPITATGVDSESQTNTTVATQTGDDGCVTFAVTTFGTDGTRTVTLTEGTFGPDWSETAPGNGLCALTGNNGSTPGANDSCSITQPTITVAVSSNDDVSAPYFGNFNPYCSTTGCTAQGLVVSKNATPAFTRTYTWGITKAVDKTEIDTSSGATFNYTVDVTHDNGADSDWQVTGTIVVANPTGTDITGVNVTDAVDDGGTCTIIDANAGANETVQAGSHINLSYTCTYTSAPSPSKGTNTATATPGTGTPVTGTATFDFGTSGTTPILVDDSVTVTDSVYGSLGTVSYADSSPKEFTYSETFSTDLAGTCTSHDNTATFTTDTTKTTGSDSKSVKVCVGADLTVTKTATAAFTPGITKSVDKTEIDTYSGDKTPTFNYTVVVTESGWSVSGNITVTNPNDWESISANVADALSDSGGACSFTGAYANMSPLSVSVPAKGGSVLIPYTCTFSSAPTAASGSNTAAVTWNNATYYTPDGTKSSGPVAYAFSALTVTDTIGGTLGTISAPVASTTYTYKNTVTAPSGTCTTVPNTASISGTGISQSASKSVKVCGASVMGISKSAVASFNTGITKTGPASPVENSGAYSLKYTVTVTESGWTVAGNIILSNPNDWESIPVTLTDLLSDTKGTCTITGGAPTSVAASTTLTLPYSCSFGTGVPSSISGTNKATVTWNPTTSFTGGNGVNSYTAGYAFNPSKQTVTDTLTNTTTNNTTTTTLGTITTPTATTTYTPTFPITPPPGSCWSFTNTATVGSQSATYPAGTGATLQVCNTNTGALTMGFWKNTNGQGIITNHCGGTGTMPTPLWSFLNGYNPFQDITTIKSYQTCSAEATYVANIISAATCTSSSNTCNSMLRAQMLATALDVYFSTPTLGGNQIGSYTGLGSKQPALGTIAVNLSAIHPCSDSSSGATCVSGSEDTRLEFGIVQTTSCLGTSIGQMLAYADANSSRNGMPVASTTTGATWYLNNKGYQVPAKDSFDDFNNQIAPITTSACSPTY